MNEQDFWEYAQLVEVNKHIINGNALVTIWCPTYNHEKFIKDALDGFLSQETNFDFQVLIYDDASNDKTAEIVKEYANQFPEIFHVFLAGRNTYWHTDRERFVTNLLRKNFVGKYVAICEGDDCWIDPYKLQIQVEYMEKHPECSLYMHNSIKINYINELKITTQNSYKCKNEIDLSSEEIIMQYRYNPATASMLLRKAFFFIPEDLAKWQSTDYMIQLNCMRKGDVHYSNRIMSVYRFGIDGSYTKKFSDDVYFWFRFQIMQINFLYQFDHHTSLKYHKWIINRIQGRVFCLIDGVRNFLEEYICNFTQQGKQVSFDSEDILDRLICIDKQVKDKNFVRNELRRFIDQFSNIIIMGTGQYSNKLSEQLEVNHIDFCGYAVSRLDEGYEFRGKKVWQLDQINKKFVGAGVVVAVKPLKWDELVRDLENAGIENYYCPFKL